MNTFQALLVLGFPVEVAVTAAMPNVFATEDTVTANDIVMRFEPRDSLPGEIALLPAAA